MQKVAVFATLVVMITVVANLIVTRLIVIIFYLRKVYKTACICTIHRRVIFSFKAPISVSEWIVFQYSLGLFF